MPTRYRFVLGLVCLAMIAALGLLPRPLPEANRRIAEATDRYGSTPKGVTLEGRADGLHKTRQAEYIVEDNAFLLNGDTVYPSPVGRAAMIEIISALASDDRIGVSFTPKKTVITYGALSEDSPVVKDLVEADRFLGGVTFAIEPLYRDIPLPGDFRPRAVLNREIVTGCYFNLKGYTFQIENNQARRTSWTMEIILFPVSEMKSSDGGYMPDLERMQAGIFEDEDRHNADHIRANAAAYAKIPTVSKAIQIGEAAAFARTLRDADQVDLNQLLKQMKGEIPSATRPAPGTATASTGDETEVTTDPTPPVTTATVGESGTETVVVADTGDTPDGTAATGEGTEVVSTTPHNPLDAPPAITATDNTEDSVIPDDLETLMPPRPGDAGTDEGATSLTGDVPPPPPAVTAGTETSEDALPPRPDEVIVAPADTDRLPGEPVPGENDPLRTEGATETEPPAGELAPKPRPSAGPDSSDVVRSEPVVPTGEEKEGSTFPFSLTPDDL